IMLMDEGLDTGPILLQEAVPIDETTTAGALHETLAALGARLIVEALDGLAAGRLEPRPQPAEGVTYAPKLRREEGRLDWRRPARELARMVRALTPWPGAGFRVDGEVIKVLAAEVVTGTDLSAAPGTVLDAHLTIACGQDALRPTRVQRPGRGALDAEAFLRGFAIAPGTRLPLPEDEDAPVP
ncbi:MAG: methionyl-tRNA formyltransferase, partial [Alphaproteobacteria bacterium]